MRTLNKLICFGGLLVLVSTIPAMAQIANQVTFEAPFAFYAGNAKLPAGSYRVTQPDANDQLLLVESADGVHSVFVEYVPVDSAEPSKKSEVTFKKYGSTDFLNSISVQGDDSGMKILQTKAEQKAAKTATASTHSLAASNGTQAAR